MLDSAVFVLSCCLNEGTPQISTLHFNIANKHLSPTHLVQEELEEGALAFPAKWNESALYGCCVTLNVFCVLF